MSVSLRQLLQRLWQHPVFALLSLALLAVIGLGGSVVGCYIWASYHYRAAERALERREFAEAMIHLSSCLQVWGGSAETHFQAARAARRAGAYDNAEQHLKECQRLGEVAEAVDLERALMRAQRGDLARVEGNLLSFVQQNHPDTELILEALTWGYMKTFRLPQAEYCLQQWLQRRPDDIQALAWRGEAAERRRGYREAMADYRRVLALDPERDAARLRLAEILVRVHQPEAAVPHFERLLVRQPGNATLLLGLARCRRLLGNTDDARQLLDQVLESSPDDVGALSERGRLAHESGQAAEAERWLRRALAKAPYDRETTYILYLCLQQQAQRDEAKELLAKLEEIDAQLALLDQWIHKIGEDPHNPAPRHEAGMIFLRSGQDKEGLRWLQSALQEEPHYRPTHVTLAEYFANAGDQTQAAWHRQQAMSDHP